VRKHHHELTKLTMTKRTTTKAKRCRWLESSRQSPKHSKAEYEVLEVKVEKKILQ
jgi:hypothetical protein